MQNKIDEGMGDRKECLIVRAALTEHPVNPDNCPIQSIEPFPVIVLPYNDLKALKCQNGANRGECKDTPLQNEDNRG